MCKPRGLSRLKVAKGTEMDDVSATSPTSVQIVDGDTTFPHSRMDLREMLEAMGCLVVGKARDGKSASTLTH